jgi:hypothetical protein
VVNRNYSIFFNVLGGASRTGLENTEESFHMPMTAKRKKKRTVKKAAAKGAAKKTKKRKKKKK